MARSHLTLAALATSAVPGLDVAGAAHFGASEGGDYDAALLTGRDGKHWIIRAPRNARVESEQSADLVALRALSAGVRTRLPFSVSAFAGQAPLGSTRAFVYEFVYGAKVTLGSIGSGPDSLASSQILMATDSASRGPTDWPFSRYVAFLAFAIFFEVLLSPCH